MEDMDKNALSPEDRADYDIVDTQIGLALFDLDIAQSWRHSPQSYVELLGSALFNPYRAGVRPEARSLRSHHRPARQDSGIHTRCPAPASGVPAIWIQVAKEENDGNIDLIDKTLREAVPAPQKQAYGPAAKRPLMPCATSIASSRTTCRSAPRQARLASRRR